MKHEENSKKFQCSVAFKPHAKTKNCDLFFVKAMFSFNVNHFEG